MRARTARSEKDDRGRLLPWIAAERTLRGALLIAAGAIALAHLDADWGRLIADAARSAGLDAHHNALAGVIRRARALSERKRAEYSGFAIAFGLLEATEGYGLWRRRRWAEYLTVIATSLFLIPEVDELLNRPTAVKAAGFALNVAIVGYLVHRLRRRGA